MPDACCCTDVQPVLSGEADGILYADVYLICSKDCFIVFCGTAVEVAAYTIFLKQGHEHVCIVSPYETGIGADRDVAINLPA